MGSTFSKKPWRGERMSWGSEYEETLIEDINEILRRNTAGCPPNLLLIGYVGAGKSSFINSVLSVDVERLVTNAPTGNPNENSRTLQYTAYKPQSRLIGFILRDTRGLQKIQNASVHVDDIMTGANGNLENNYTFSPGSPITLEHVNFRENPDVSDATHCAIIVISAESCYNRTSFTENIYEIKRKLQAERVPIILLLTKADLVCEEVRKDPAKLFRSKKIQQAVIYASETFKIDQSLIHPVVNYNMDSILTPPKNIYILLAIKQSLQYAVDRVIQHMVDREVR